MTIQRNASRSADKKYCTVMLAGLALALVLIVNPLSLPAEKHESRQVTVLVSKHIKPYMDALQGLRDALAQMEISLEDIYMLDQEDLKRLSAQEFPAQNTDLFVAIGPEALNYLDQMAQEFDLDSVYCMVLDPEQLTSAQDLLACGISLSLPAKRHLQDIKQALPQAEQVGLLFNPEENHSFYQQVKAMDNFLGLQIVPLQVSSSQEIPEVLQANWESIDALWMIPDSTVISRSLVQYIIKEAVYAQKPVVGYNRFFYDSGAAVAYAFDYQQIGYQTGKLVDDKLRGLPCSSNAPAYELLINKKVMRSLGLQLPEGRP